MVREVAVHASADPELRLRRWATMEEREEPRRCGDGEVDTPTASGDRFLRFGIDSGEAGGGKPGTRGRAFFSTAWRVRAHE